MVLKTAMILSCAEADSLTIRLKDIEQSIHLLQEIVRTAPKALGAHGRSKTAVDTQKILGQIRDLRTVAYSELISMNYLNTDKETLDGIISTLISMNRVKMTYDGPKQILVYIKPSKENEIIM